MSVDPKPVQSWCVILQTFSKKNKKDLVRELVKGFGLDEKEASDTLANLPILLVDQLGLNQAKCVKEKLGQAGAEVEVTNHDLIKKQCFRIEWPEQPDLKYFEKSDEPAKAPSQPLPQAPSQPTPVSPVPMKPVPSSVVTPVPASVFRNAQKPPTPPAASAKPKKAWFPFGRNDKKPAPPKPEKSVLNQAQAKKASEPKLGTATPRPASVPEIDQTDWQKRTREIQERLERIGSSTQPVPAPVKKEEPVADEVNKQSVDPQPPADVSPVQPLPQDKPETKPAPEPVLPEEPAPLFQSADNLAAQSNDLLEKIQKLEQELQEKQRNLEEKHAEVEHRQREAELKQRQAEEAKKLGVEFSEKVVQLEKALTEKEQNLTAKHSELEERSQRERDLADVIAKLEARIAEQAAESDLQKKEIARLNIQYEENLKVKDQELEVIQKRMQEIAQKFQVVEQGIYEKQNELTQKESELQAKEQKIRDLQQRGSELEKKAEEAQALEKDKDQQVSGLLAREKELLKKVESLDKTLVEMGEALRERDESLRQRDEVLVALERRVQDLAEKTGDFDSLKAEHAKMKEEFGDVSGRYTRLMDEYRRFKSKSERKTASLTREMGEWVRKVDHLRQGLQKFNQNIVRPDLAEDSEPENDAAPSA